ncbi:MAG: HAMP domain-containing protein [Anaerolineales bacterium]|nr:HAMP domain-containing protein [Anaerolineales bacterium]
MRARLPPPHSLGVKLTLAFLAVALTVAGLVALFLRLTNANQLDRLIIEQQRRELHSALVDYYTANGSWAGVYAALFQRGGPPATQSVNDHNNWNAGPHPGYGGGHNRWGLFALVNAAGVVISPLYPAFPPGAVVAARALASGEAVEVNGQVVGTILTAGLPPGLTPEESAYLERTNTALLLAGLGAVAVALIVGLLLARTLTRPLQALTQAADRMAGGDLEQEVTVRGNDEIGALAAAFNQMSRAVARANKARRQMTADVAHELRTPLTVVGGYIESMRDGVVAPTPERLSVIYAEVEHLQHLVGDLRTLSQADAGELKLNRQPVAPEDLLHQAVTAFEHQAEQQGVRLAVEGAPAAPAVDVDEVRLTQVLSNLVSNALRYTPHGGHVTLKAEPAGSQVTLTVADTGPGIAPAHLPFIFNRFYRADMARTGEGGESGLGLAIVKALVEAHGGTIEAHSDLGRGTTFAIRLAACRPSGAA